MDFVILLAMAFVFDIGALLICFRTLAGQASRFEEIAFWPIVPLGVAIPLSIVSLLFTQR